MSDLTPHQRLRQLREEQGWPRQKVAYEMGIAERTLIRHELGYTPLRRRMVLAYARYYGVPPEQLENAEAVA